MDGRLGPGSDADLGERYLPARLIGGQVPGEAAAGEELGAAGGDGCHALILGPRGQEVKYRSTTGLIVDRDRSDIGSLRMDVEIRQLRSFVAVAEERNFTRAAERLRLAQPALSAQIRQLEQRMGVQLLERTTRKVDLTPAGEALRERARLLLDGVEAAVQQAQDTAAGRTGRLRVGLAATASLDLTPLALRAFAEAVPGAQVSVQDIRFDDPSGGVRDGTTDVAITWTPFDEAGLDVEQLTEEPRRIVLSRDHRLADAPQITSQDELLVGARSGRLIAAMPQALVHQIPFDDIVAREVEGLRPTGVASCRLAGNDNPLVEAFVQAVRQAAGR